MPKILSSPPRLLMDWRKLVKTSWMSLTLSLVGAPVMGGKSAVALAKRSLDSSAVVMMTDGLIKEAGGV